MEEQASLLTRRAEQFRIDESTISDLQSPEPPPPASRATPLRHTRRAA
jgi:hypothetical protein